MAGHDKLAAPIGGRPLLGLDPGAAGRGSRDRADRRGHRRGALAEVAAADWLPASVVEVIAGGERRQESVAAGVARLAREPGGAGPERVILVQDGARPMVTPSSWRRRRGGPGVRCRDPGPGDGRDGQADRRRADRRDARPGRPGHRPDAAGDPARPARAAYARSHRAASRPSPMRPALLEACRIPVHVVPGDPMNLKVTVPEDLGRADAPCSRAGRRRPDPGRLRQRRASVRAGRAAGPGRDPDRRRAATYGHSDGDVALHAIADALLGACGLGDLGRLFPAGPATPAGIDSAELLRASWTASWPRLAARLDRPRDRRRAAAPRGAGSTRCATRSQGSWASTRAGST